MKKLFLFSLIIFMSSSICLADWGLGSGGTNQEVNIYEAEKKDGFKGDESKGGALSNGEAAWNIDFELFPFLMPDQPADDQFISTVTGLGMTYKFSDKIHFLTKVVQLELEGKQGTKWKHTHYLAGFGMRSFFANNSQQWQINVLTGTSEVSEDKLGKIKNLEAPVFADIKYLWLFGESFLVGPQITFARVANKCEEINGTTMECGSGGYAGVGVVFQIGMPDSWGK